MPKQFIASPQQAAVVDFIATGRGSAFVEAVAGAGKTTTLLEALVVTTGSVGFAAFNKKIADEIKLKIADRSNSQSDNYDPRYAAMGNRVRVGTFHSFGLGAWRRVYPSVKVDADAKWLATVEALQVPRPLQGFVRRLLSLAKQNALGLHGSVDDVRRYYDIVDHHDMAYDLEDDSQLPQGIELAIKALHFHRDHAAAMVDFDDMIYMPVVTPTRIWQNDFVFVDEAQDTNPVRRALARKMLRSNGRAVFVGDRHQAIYGFTGADNDAIDQIVRDFSCKSLPLTITYRCPKAVVRAAQTVVSHIEAHETAPEGEVTTIEQDNLMANAATLLPTDAILCRKTKPLVETAFSLIRTGVACHVEGRDIGTSLVKLIDKFKTANTLDDLLARIDAHGERRAAMLVAKGKDSQAEALMDRVATIHCIAGQCETVEEVKQRIVSMFEDSDSQRKQTLTLSTVHKSKGREWPRVFVLGKNAWMPGPWAKQQWEVEQEMNLIYVAYTRAQKQLVLVNVPVER